MTAITTRPTPITVIVAQSVVVRDAGLELTLGYEAVRDLARATKDAGGSLSVGCVVDDVYVGKNEIHTSELIGRLYARHFAITHTQRIAASLTSAGLVDSPALILPLHGSRANFDAAILGQANQGSIYLCYPINLFRRQPEHPLKAELEAFRERIAGLGRPIYDPLSIDEEHLISGVTQAVERTATFPRDARFPAVSAEWVANPTPPLIADITIMSDTWRAIARAAKTQVPERDFFWIESCSFVVSWRPFLGGVHHAGVLAELQYALHQGKDVVAFSPPEDGGEHPSPFASMVETISDSDKFWKRVTNHAPAVEEEEARMAAAEGLPKYCDHTSVGILILNKRNELLLIERGTFPFGMAPPAGHVDDHGDYEVAARAEAFEEVGLSLNDLRLVAQGRKDNPCRRVGGSWHYWKVYVAHSDGDLRLSPREAKAARWCSREDLMALAMLDEADAEAASPSGRLESVWRTWLLQLPVWGD